MGKLNSIPNISRDDLRDEVRKEYANVALDPHKGYHFHTGRIALRIIGYDESLFEGLPVTLSNKPKFVALADALCSLTPRARGLHR